MLSTMSAKQVDGSQEGRIAELGRQVLAGGEITPEQGRWLFHLQGRGEVFELLAWANRIRERFKGNKVHLCSIVNLKAGGCPEDCRFCAQSARYETDSPRHAVMERETVLAATEEARANGVAALGLVAAWRGLEEGAVLDEVCRHFEDMKQCGDVRADASLGMIRSQKVADRLAQAGVACYNHNLETSERFFPQVCTTHTYADRLRTVEHLRQAGIKICSGGILGMGESPEDRCDLAFTLKEIGAQVVPMNFLNPIPGTPFAHCEPLAPLEILKSIACFRFILPRQEITVAGGRTVNLRDVQSLVFLAGASGLMVGNYLTTLNQPVEKDLQMLKDLGLDPKWDKHELCDQEEPRAVPRKTHTYA